MYKMKSADYYINGGFIVSVKDREETEWKIEILQRI